MLQIQDMLIKYNYSKRTNTIKYIVIHTTGNTSKGAGVKNHFNYFNGGDRQSSADYFVDDSNIARFVKDTNYAWHCGDGSGQYGITNNNSLGIEFCVNSDGDFKKTVSNAIDLVKYLMNKYNIGIDNVVQHWNASRKNCPKELREGKDGITWAVFKQRLTSSNNSDELYRVRKSWSDVQSQIGAFKNLDLAKDLADKNPGYSVFNSKGEKVYPIDKNFVVGAKVKIIGTNYATGQAIPDWVKKNVYTIKEIRGEQALISDINSLVYLKDLQLV